MKRITALATCFVLLMALAAFAQTTKKSTAPKVVTAKVLLVSGTINSADATSLVITRKGATGSPEQMTFVLDAKTTKTGDMIQGATAAVHYTTNGTTNTATSVKATPAKVVAPKKVAK
jgi:hypothetical protein